MGSGMTENVDNAPVWVNTSNCKACDICVSVCPSGVLGMIYDPKSTLGAMISIDNPEACIGCNECELTCPDFAIYVANSKDYKAAGFSFAKLTDESKARQQLIKENNYMSLDVQGVK